jgi:hypothetical protein
MGTWDLIRKVLSRKTGILAILLLFLCMSLTWYFYVCANVQMDWIEFLQFKDKYRNSILGIGTALLS